MEIKPVCYIYQSCLSLARLTLMCITSILIFYQTKVAAYSQLANLLVWNNHLSGRSNPLVAETKTTLVPAWLETVSHYMDTYAVMCYFEVLCTAVLRNTHCTMTTLAPDTHLHLPRAAFCNWEHLFWSWILWSCYTPWSFEPPPQPLGQPLPIPQFQRCWRRDQRNFLTKS